MNLSISLIFHLFVSSLMIFKTGEGSVDHGSWIEQVYDEYRMSEIIITTTNDLSFEKMTALQIILKEIYAKGIRSVIVEFRQLEKTINLDQKRSTCPLVLILIDKITDIQEFNQGMVNMDMRYHVWLVLFTRDEHEDLCEYYCHPVQSSFSTDILVSCCNLGSIVKWNSKRTNHSTSLFCNEETEEVNGTERHTRRALNTSRQFLVNKEFNIAITKEVWYIWRGDDRLYGYLGEIIMELSEVMNFSISQVLEEPYGFFQLNASKWTGIIGAVTQGKAEIGAASFIITSERMTVVDFSLPIMHGEYAIYIAKSVNFSVQWDGFLKVFHPKVWIVIVIFLLITPLLLIIIEYKKGCILLDIISIHYLNVWGIFCWQSWSNPPEGKPSRIIFLSLFISALVVNASYSAALIRHLMSAPPYVPFHTVQEFVNDGTYKIITTRGGVIDNWLRTTNDTLIKTMKTLMEPSDSFPITDAEAFKQLCTRRIALVTIKYEKQFPTRAQCATIALPLGRKINIGVILPLGSEYTRFVNYHIQRFRENGMLNRLKQKYSTKSRPANTSYDSVTFKDILPILIIFAVGCSIAAIIFSQEKQ